MSMDALINELTNVLVTQNGIPSEEVRARAQFQEKSLLFRISRLLVSRLSLALPFQ